MKQINPSHISALTKLINKSAYFTLLSMRVCRIEPGYCAIKIHIDEKHKNPYGGIHGGVYSSAIDSAAYYAVYCSVGEDDGLISMDLHVDNLATSDSSKVAVEGKLIKAGRTVCLSEATVKDADGKLLANGTSKQLVTHGLQTLHQAVVATGNGLLPPKFLD